MEAKDFLNNELGILASNFPAVHVRYGYNNKIEAHIVELLPENEYYQNKQLDKSWIEISLRFNETFLTEEVVFISSDSSLSLEEVISEYNVPTCNETEVMSDLFASFSDQPIDYSFDTNFTNGKVITAKIDHFSAVPVSTESNDEYDDCYNYLIAA